MELKLKKDIQESYIYDPFSHTNILGKFIEEPLYPHLYNLYPEYFEVATKASKIVLNETEEAIIDAYEVKNKK